MPQHKYTYADQYSPTFGHSIKPSILSSRLSILNTQRKGGKVPTQAHREYRGVRKPPPSVPLSSLRRHADVGSPARRAEREESPFLLFDAASDAKLLNDTEPFFARALPNIAMPGTKSRKRIDSGQTPGQPHAQVQAQSQLPKSTAGQAPITLSPAVEKDEKEEEDEDPETDSEDWDFVPRATGLAYPLLRDFSASSSSSSSSSLARRSSSPAAVAAVRARRPAPVLVEADELPVWREGGFGNGDGEPRWDSLRWNGIVPLRTVVEEDVGREEREDDEMIGFVW